jgi:osmotically-inducible protein OsmY
VVNPLVQDGTVDLWGEVGQGSDRKAIELLAKNVAGVRTVRDHLTVTETSVT